MSINQKNIGERLKTFRKSKGINIVAFSKLLCISHGSLSGLENNKSKPSSDTLINLCRNTDINIYWLFTGEGEMTRKLEKEIGIAENSTYIYKEGNTRTHLDDDPGIADLLESARRVLKSGNQVAFDALERNIRYFDHAIKTEKRLKIMESRLEVVEKHLPQKSECKNTEKKIM